MKMNFNGRRVVKLLGVSGLAATMLFSSTLPTVLADNTPQTLPYVQDWSNTGLITANDDWSAVPGVVGYLTIAGATGENVDPQTLLGDSQTVDVVANQSNAATNGGVLEVQTASNTTANPTPANFSSSIGIQGSGTAIAPNIVVNIDTSSVTTGQVAVSYNARDLDSTADDAVQPVAVQYRIGTTGNFTNLPGGYIPDATTGGGTASPQNASLVTTRNFVLPVAANQQPVVQVRFVTTNRTGNDELVGIDDINIRAIAPTASTATVSGRVLSGRRSVARATVVLTDLTTGATYRTLSSGFGYYSFSELETGRLYTVRVESKRFGFAETQAFQLDGDKSDVNIAVE